MAVEITHNSPFKSYREKYNFFCRRCPALEAFKELASNPSDLEQQGPKRLSVRCIVSYRSGGSASVNFIANREFEGRKDKFTDQGECPVVRSMRMHPEDVPTRFDWAIRLIKDKNLN